MNMMCVLQRSTSVSICITCLYQLSTWGTATVASTTQASLLMTRSVLALQMQRSHLVMWVPFEQCSSVSSTARFISQYRLNSAADWLALPVFISNWLLEPWCTKTFHSSYRSVLGSYYKWRHNQSLPHLFKFVKALYSWLHPPPKKNSLT
jgi:hypothetical protein